MSWVEKIKEQLVIITGDKREYRPLYLNAVKAVSYNVTSFEFPNVEGSLVKRREPKGNKYKIEIYFQGDDHLDVAKEFENSAKDKRTWVIRHPFYDDINVHPTDLIFDNTKYNYSKITGNILETISDSNPQAIIVPEDKIIQDKEDADEITAAAYVNNNPVPSVSDVNSMTDTNVSVSNETERLITDEEEIQTFRNVVNTATSDINNAVGEPLAAIRSMQEVISFPSLVQQSVELRLNTLITEATSLSNTISVLTGRSDKFLYENNAGTMITAMCVTVATPLNEFDYANRNAVLNIVGLLLGAFELYIETLDLILTEDADELDSFTPDSDSIIAIENLVNFSVSNLFTIALDSKQERQLILEDDSNVILLAHRFLGPSVDDVNIDEFIRNNDIGLSEILEVKKGRIIRYYI